MDPSLPARGRSRSPATGSRAASGRTRRRSPRPIASTSAGAACCPGSATRTCTSRPGRSRSARCGSRDALARGGARAGARPRSASVRAGTLAPRPRLAERRLAPAVEPTRQALDAVTGDTPDGADRARLALALAQLGGARARGRRLQVPGGVVELDERGEPTGVLREESAWQFRERTCSRPTTSTSTRCARGSGSPRRAA